LMFNVPTFSIADIPLQIAALPILDRGIVTLN